MTSTEDYEEIIHEIDELRKDPAKFEQYIAARVDTVLKHWPRR